MFSFSRKLPFHRTDYVPAIFFYLWAQTGRPFPYVGTESRWGCFHRSLAFCGRVLSVAKLREEMPPSRLSNFFLPRTNCFTPFMVAFAVQERPPVVHPAALESESMSLPRTGRRLTAPPQLTSTFSLEPTSHFVSTFWSTFSFRPLATVTSL